MLNVKIIFSVNLGDSIIVYKLCNGVDKNFRFFVELKFFLVLEVDDLLCYCFNRYGCMFLN